MTFREDDPRRQGGAATSRAFAQFTNHLAKRLNLRLQQTFALELPLAVSTIRAARLRCPQLSFECEESCRA